MKHDSPEPPRNLAATAIATDSDGRQLPVYLNSARPVSLAQSLREIWQYRALISELVRRDLKVRYKNRVGGLLWSLANPLMQVATITLMVRFFFANPVPNYSAYLMAVMFIWTFFSASVLDSSIVFLSNVDLVRKVYFPRAVLQIVSVAGNLIHFTISIVFTIGYFFVLGAYPEHLRPMVLLAIPVTFFMSALALGLSYMLSYLNTLYEDVRFIATTLLGLAFYVLPILYPIERVAAARPVTVWHWTVSPYHIYMLDPLAPLLVTYQHALLDSPIVKSNSGVVLPALGIPWHYLILACCTSTVILIAGFALFERCKWTMVERI